MDELKAKVAVEHVKIVEGVARLSHREIQKKTQRVYIEGSRPQNETCYLTWTIFHEQ